MPIARTSAATRARIHGPPSQTARAANGKAASEPTLPGATGDKPQPNHVESQTDGCEKGSDRRVIGLGPIDIQDSRNPECVIHGTPDWSIWSPTDGQTIRVVGRAVGAGSRFSARQGWRSGPPCGGQPPVRERGVVGS